MERPSLPRDPLTLSAGIVPMRPDQISRNPTLNPWLLACLLGGALTPAVDAAAPAARPPATKPAAKAAAAMAPAAYLAALDLKVTGSETVTVPAGAFEAFAVEVASPDDGAKITFWVAKAAAKVVKSVAVVPQSGATLTTELQ
jgi:hypothetical protein